MSAILSSALAPGLKACTPRHLKRILLDLWPDAGWSNRVEYEPGTGALALFPNIHLETCDESVASVQVTVELETSHIGKGCDRDTYSEKSLHRLCGKEAWGSSGRWQRPWHVGTCLSTFMICS